MAGPHDHAAQRGPVSGEYHPRAADAGTVTCPPGGIPQRCVTAFDRWRTDPSSLAHPAPLVAGAFGPAAA